MIDLFKMIEKIRRDRVEKMTAMPPDEEGTNKRGVEALMLVGHIEALEALEAQVRSALASDYLGELYRTTLVVQGKGAFPIDMLRYICAWPDGESDAQKIGDSQDPEHYDPEPLTITLQKYHRDATPSLGEDRWLAKFGWKVIRHDTRLL